MRRPDWSKRLVDVVEEAKHLPFNYGEHDCITFVARCVDAMCDTEHFARVRSYGYLNEVMAKQVLETSGGLTQLISAVLGEPMANRKFAAPGDVVLIELGGVEFTGIVVGHSAVTTGPSGFVVYPYRTIVKAWRI